MRDPSILPFRPGRLSLGGLQLLRATAQLSHGETEDHVLWRVDVLTPPSGDSARPDLPFLVIADLHAVKESLFVGATYAAPVQLPPRHHVPDVSVPPLREALLRLFGETLWDVAAMNAGHLAAMSRESLDLPHAMPKPSEQDDVDPCVAADDHDESGDE